MTPHTLILTPDLLARIDAAGFNGGDLGAWLVERAERAQDFEDDYRRVVAEECAPDERHCSCVPHLRRRIAEVEGERDEAQQTARLADEEGAKAIERVSQAIIADKWNATAAFQDRALKAEAENARMNVLLTASIHGSARLQTERDAARADAKEYKELFRDAVHSIANIARAAGFSPTDGNVEPPAIAARVDHLRANVLSRKGAATPSIPWPTDVSLFINHEGPPVDIWHDGGPGGPFLCAHTMDAAQAVTSAIEELHEARAAAVAKDAEIRRLTERIAEAERERDDARNGADLAADRANRHRTERDDARAEQATREAAMMEALPLARFPGGTRLDEMVVAVCRWLREVKPELWEVRRG